MEKILKLIEFIGFTIVTNGLVEYDTYVYKQYKVFIEKESLGFSLHNQDKNKEHEKLIIFNCTLDDENNIKQINSILNQEFKYELRKIKIENLKLNDF
ncbi:MAG: hypothetical protein RLZZ546_1547 [Bacteroidota bacterium]|jgi:hypothetical protein